jgi:hypothetical protein
MMPTRYALELEGLKGLISYETFKEPSQREETKKVVKKLFEEKYQGGKSKWFFTALRVSSPPISSLISPLPLYADGILTYTPVTRSPIPAALPCTCLVLTCPQSHLDHCYDEISHICPLSRHDEYRGHPVDI